MKYEISVTDAEFNGLSSEVYSNGIPHPELGLGLLSLLNCLFCFETILQNFPYYATIMFLSALLYSIML